MKCLEYGARTLLDTLYFQINL